MQDPPYTGLGDIDVVVALEVHRDLVRAEVIVLAQVHELADHVRIGLVWAVLRS